jgi:thymidylate synthase
MFLKGIIEELLFFIRGETDSKLLESKGINIWKGNTSREFLDANGFKDRKEGEMGPMYGSIWRNFNVSITDETKDISSPIKFGIDQLQNVINEIRNNPTSRRILLTTYNPSQAHLGVLYPCHSITIQFYIQNEFIDMFCYNRSSDLFLGLPFNIASTSLLLCIIAKITKLTPRYVNISLGDVHVYGNHEKAVQEQIIRIPYIFPHIELPEIKELEDIEKASWTDFKFQNYSYYPSIKAEMVA